MRVALLTYSTKPRGGVVHTLHLAEALARLGVDVTVWSLARAGDRGFFREVDAAVTVRLVEFTDHAGDTVTDRIVRSIDVLARAFTPAVYDIVHAQDCISANAVGRCIRTIHHLDQFTTPVLAECHEKAIVEPYARICVSSAVAAEVRCGWGFEPAVIPNGVDAQRFIDAATDTDAQDRWRERLGRYVLTVGGIEPRKGTLDLVESYHLMRQRFPELSLVIAGGETLFDYRDYRGAFDNRCAELDVQPLILGAIADHELPALVAGCEVFAFPSTKEGFGLAAVEALAAGRPVVARDLPVLREVFGDTVRFAADAPGFATEMAAALQSPPDPVIGRALAESMTWQAAAQAHLDFYRNHL
ncbi:MSMEG_0565 family glycosyltransferase [Mycolicibacterium mucogenicum]|uniref:Glycosyl transferase family 1 n=1 Tax=Mycolicibacterium mucogenicum TaxID=56689 RepID=A0A1A0LYE3_MYCMU|nr:MSMEG_0565 family glycosyltransferase [Mycolicibacterium mucogenicum]OBA77623.1 glycosyl transferase family 1 [Mycolicibacterium mucogenicum]TDK89069.1 MSMEG_0565 family glycosyltransferase [Mycolicibacterium mucogenicum]SHV76002.1 glycosyl transferase family protein [Mycobacteroides abscessus subsp. abscessus]